MRHWNVDVFEAPAKKDSWTGSWQGDQGEQQPNPGCKTGFRKAKHKRTFVSHFAWSASMDTTVLECTDTGKGAADCGTWQCGCDTPGRQPLQNLDTNWDGFAVFAFHPCITSQPSVLAHCRTWSSSVTSVFILSNCSCMLWHRPGNLCTPCWVLLSWADVRQPFTASSHPCSSHLQCWPCHGGKEGPSPLCNSLVSPFLSCPLPCPASLGYKPRWWRCQAQRTFWQRRNCRSRTQ